jgi:hypothetical protein
MRSLPEWFGIESSVVAYADAVGRMESYVAMDGATVAGFIAVDSRSEVASEIHVLAVARPYHGSGAGRALEHVERLLAVRGIESAGQDARSFETRRAQRAHARVL